MVDFIHRVQEQRGHYELLQSHCPGCKTKERYEGSGGDADTSRDGWFSPVEVLDKLGLFSLEERSL